MDMNTLKEVADNLRDKLVSGVVVLAKNGGNAEYVRDHENAIYYDPKDLNTAVKIIKQLTENDVLYNKLSKNGIETAKQRDWSEIKDQVLDLYL